MTERPDDDDRSQASRTFLTSEAHYQALVSQVKDYAIFSLDVEGRALTWNDGVGAVLGYARDEFIGSPIELPFTPEDIEAGVPRRELQTARTQGVADDDRWLMRKDGARFFATGRTTRFDDEQGRCIGFTKVLRDDTERVLAEERKQQTDARLRALIQNVRDYAIFMLDADGFVTEWTEGAQRVKGYSASEVAGRHLAMFFTPEDVATGEPQREIRRAAEVGRVEREGWRVRKGGERFWANEIATAIRSDDGKLLGFTKISRDLTERKRFEEALLQADQRKDEFLATLAHELRNPLAPLRNGLLIVRRLAAGTPMQRTLDMMERQLAHLVRLVDDLLDVARISSGKIELRRRPLDLRDVLAASAEAVRVSIDTRRHELVLEPGSEVICVDGDFDRLVQVFSNLLSNAAKYTEVGGRIHVSTQREGREICVAVADTGIGIPVADLRHVFDIFSQVRAHQGRSEGGLGIGLSLVQSLVSMHGGRVTVSSEGPGKGSTFTVHLPLWDAVPGRPDLSSREEHPAVAVRHRILIADDNVDAAASLATLLELDGHEVTVAHDGEDAVMKATAFRPTLAFIDLGMPKLNGFEAARRLRALPLGGQAVLVALTGWGQASDRERTREAGFDFHIVKPVQPQALAEVLSQRSVAGQSAGS
jgi:PAS domain S-box-containing protein